MDGSEGKESSSCFKMTGTVAPGMQRVIAFLKRTFLIMESPIIYVVGVEEKSDGIGSGSVLVVGDGGMRSDGMGSDSVLVVGDG